MGQEAQSRHTVIDSGGGVIKRGKKLISSQLMAGKRRQRRTFFGAELVWQRPGFRRVMHHLPLHWGSFQGCEAIIIMWKRWKEILPSEHWKGKWGASLFFFFFFFPFSFPSSLRLSPLPVCTMCSERVWIPLVKSLKVAKGVYCALR